MPGDLSPIPLEVPITDQGGTITVFFRERWQQLMSLATQAATKAAVSLAPGQNAAIPTTAAYTTQASGFYRLSYYMRKTAADGVASSLTFTAGWTDHGVPLTGSGAALTLDTTGAFQPGAFEFYSDANADITYAAAYVSTTPGAMAFLLEVRVELLL